MIEIHMGFIDIFPRFHPIPSILRPTPGPKPWWMQGMQGMG
jgi:hypothetical protein